VQVRVTILVENTTPVPELIGEYGFACLVDIDGRQLLFDTGSAGALLTNSTALGIDLGRVQEVVISHGHYDHTGALLPLLKHHGPKKIYAHPMFLLPKLIPLKNGKIKEIGTPCDRGQLEQAGGHLVLQDYFTAIGPGLFLSGEIPRRNDFEDVGGPFQVECGGQVIADRLADELVLIVDHPRGLIIISGCGHAGLINIIDHALEVTGRTRVLAYIGGTHLMTASPQRLEKTVAALQTSPLERLIVAHCTGFYAAAHLYNALGEMLVKAETGMRFDFLPDQ
jgi:7,8-dihydropterin-6-yl-methyl-4-(beta-D-ribofuranosyl)aminobenzene 5'-phosphate synthase